MQRPGGQVTIVCDGGTREADTYSCGHCQRVVVVPAKADPANLGGMCYACMHLVCPACVAKAECTPIEKWLEQQERRADTLRSYGLA